MRSKLNVRLPILGKFQIVQIQRKIGKLSECEDLQVGTG